MEIIETVKMNDGKLLMFGGGAYQMPKYQLAHTNNSIDVIEIDKTNIIKHITPIFFFIETHL